MNSIYLAFSVVFPLFMMIALGYFLKVIHILNDIFLKQLNNLCFKVFLPFILFINVYKSNFKEMFSFRLVIFALSSILVCFIILILIIPRIEMDNKRRGIMVQGIFRSNYILFGIPIAVSFFGNEAASTTAILIAVVIPLFNMLSVIALEIWNTERSSVKKL